MVVPVLEHQDVLLRLLDAVLCCLCAVLCCLEITRAEDICGVQSDNVVSASIQVDKTGIERQRLTDRVQSDRQYLEMYVSLEHDFVRGVSNTSCYDGVVSSCVVK